MPQPQGETGTIFTVRASEDIGSLAKLVLTVSAFCSLGFLV
jgi:hypothetical protein